MTEDTKKKESPGKSHDELHAAPRPRLNINRSAVRLHNALRDGETQPTAAMTARPRRVHPVKPLEDVREVLERYPRAVVAHMQ
jgi:hypothetical protein